MGWNGLLSELEREFAVPADLLKVYNISDVDRECDYQCYVTGSNREKKLSELAQLQDEGQYELDLELPCADANELTRIKVNSGRCSIISKKDLLELDTPGKEYKIKLESTGFRRKPKGKKLKIVTNSLKDGHQYKKFVVEDDPASSIEIDMKDTENPSVAVVKNRDSKMIDPDEVAMFFHNAQLQLGKRISGEIAIGTLNLLTFVSPL